MYNLSFEYYKQFPIHHELARPVMASFKKVQLRKQDGQMDDETGND